MRTHSSGYIDSFMKGRWTRFIYSTLKYHTKQPGQLVIYNNVSQVCNPKYVRVWLASARTHAHIHTQRYYDHYEYICMYLYIYILFIIRILYQ